MRVLPVLVLAIAASGCNRSSSGDSAQVLASAVIGPAGGVLEVASGAQAGLRLTVPPGALAEPTELRVRQVLLVASLPGPAIAASAGDPFLLEPSGLRLEERATLRAPYRIMNVYETAPGNVRVREVRSGNNIDYAPVVVDIIAGTAEVPIRYLNRYQVVQGLPAQGIAAYAQPTGTSVQLADGISVAFEEVAPPSPFSQPDAVRWRITTPQGFLTAVDLLYFVGDRMVGRESFALNWREVWSQPYPVWTRMDAAPSAMTMNTQVSRPIGTPPTGGQITVFGGWSWTAPRTIAGQLLLDVAQLRVSLAWNRQDLGVGQREYRFLFAPGIGLVGLIEDGVEHLRTSF